MRYKIEGGSLPVVTIELNRGESIFTQSGGMSWMSEGISMSTNTRGGFMKGLGRMFAGESMFMATYRADAPGATIAFASTVPGQVLPIDAAENGGMICQKGAFLCAQDSVNLDVTFTKKFTSGLFGGEGHTEEMRKLIEERWHITATENYGMSELVGPGVSGECTEKCGMHINEDYFYCEVVDPETGEPVPEGEWGELVVTPLKKQALPLLRYRTHDITRLIKEPCKCGRTTIRMQKIAGRSDDMLIIRGVNVFPSQIESALIGMEGIGPHYEIVVTKKGFMDQIEVKVELTDASLLEAYGELEALTKKIHDKLKVVLQIDAKVTLVSPNTLKRFEGKAKRVTDLR